MADYKPPIGRIVASVGALLLKVLDSFASRITHESSRQIVRGLIDAQGQLISALSDTDPDDDRQVRQIVNLLVTTSSFAQGSKMALVTNIGKIKNEPLKAALTGIIDNGYAVAGIATDDVTDDGAQLKEHLRTYLRTEQGVQWVVGILDILLDEQMAAVVAIIIIDALLVAIGEGANPGLISKLQALRARYDKKIV